MAKRGVLIDLVLALITQDEQIKMLPESWRTLAMCESSLNPEAMSPTGKFKGLFQFSQESWEFVGGRGEPQHASVSRQYRRAKQLQEIQGWNAWPECSKKIGVSDGSK